MGISFKRMVETLVPIAQPDCAITALVVEDHAATGRLWVDVLSPFLAVRQVFTVSSALREIEHGDIDILILDWRLQDENADSVLTSWNRHNGGPVAVITGGMNQDDRYALYPKGVWNTFRKPLSIDVVISVVRNYQQYVLMKKERAYYLQQLVATRRIVLIFVGLMVLSSVGNIEWALNLFGF